VSRITQCFSDLKTNKRKALISYITAGDPHPSSTVEIMHALVESGSDIIELGVPFSDPMADGPSIQKAGLRALAEKTTLTDVLALAKRFRESDQTTPLVLMGYANPVHRIGYEAFAASAADVVAFPTVDAVWSGSPGPAARADVCVSFAMSGVRISVACWPATSIG